MTDKPTPTDAELKAMWQLHAADIGGIFDFARAVLAKWGTLRAEKIVIPTDTMEQEFQNHYRHGYEAGKNAATPQPTQPQAGAVTDAQVLAAVRVVSPGLFRNGLQPLPNDGANTAAQMRKEADTVRKMLEAANGIKGGQHVVE